MINNSITENLYQNFLPWLLDNSGQHWDTLLNIIRISFFCWWWFSLNFIKFSPFYLPHWKWKKKNRSSQL